ncbi:MAG: NAD(P)-binding domain-containing protein [Acidobacteriia bacterium]|nr:NAD(P)-binding domain-containing protein [Terriglobia bacterium]
MSQVDVAVIGAGPYGLSIAAHLKAAGRDFRIFGGPMSTWTTRMPRGMQLKSEGFASSLSDPDSQFTLADYCKQEGFPYADLGLPVPLETFTSYGRAFQRRFVPEVEDKLVVSVCRSSTGFQIRLEDEEIVAARRVVVAVGLSHFEHIPPFLSALPSELLTHSSRHCALDRFKGREVAVVGSGASALDLAALLHKAGALVHLAARDSVIRFHDPPEIPRPLWKRIRYPMTGIGSGWKPLFCTSAPLLFRRLPERFRLHVVRRLLGPAPAWFIKDQTVGNVQFHLGVSITRPELQNNRVSLQLTDRTGAGHTLAVDHVIAATGYKVDLRRLAFLDSELLAGIRSVDQTPVLSSDFESSVPGLYFVGTSSANTFGPLMRFVFGARFTAQRLMGPLAKSGSHGLKDRVSGGLTH